MASKQSETIVSPVGRIIMGNLYTPRTTDGNGNPIVYKSGDKIGQPRPDFFFALAIPKGAEVAQPHGPLNWIHTPWGQKIYAAGTAFLAHAGSLPTFAWKVGDGDSVVPNSKGNKLADREGAKGHWVLYFSGTTAPRLCNADGSAPLNEPDAILPGYFVQVAFTVKGNDRADKPGVYLNSQAVARQAYGEVIQTGIDTASVGFGGAALPTGASAVPLAGMPTVSLPGPAAALPGPAALPVAAAPLAALPGPFCKCHRPALPHLWPSHSRPCKWHR